MATCYELEVDSEAFTCLWLTQKSFNKQHAVELKNITGINEIDDIFCKPHISVLASSHVDNFDFIVGCLNQWNIKCYKTSKEAIEDVIKTNVLVVLLSPIRQHGICRLSEKDFTLLNILDDSIEQPVNIVYLVETSDKKVIFNTEDLEMLSDEIHLKFGGKSEKNRIFKKLFLSTDNQVQVRVGACLLDSLIRTLKSVYDKLYLFDDYMNNILTELVQKKDMNINFLEKFISNSDFKICNLASQRSNCEHLKDFSKILRREIENRFLFFGGKSSKGTNTHQLENNFETRLENILTKRLSLLRKYHFNELHRRTTKATCMTLTRSMTKERSASKGLSTSQEFETKMIRRHYCLKRCSTIFRIKDYKEMATDVYTELLNFLTIFVKDYTEDLADFLQKISDERLNRVNSLNIHEWKTIAMRNVLTKGFGCVGQNIRIYLKNDEEKNRTSVFQYVQKYLDDPPGKYQLQIEYKERKITLFSKLEQGSKINREETTERTDEPKKYGSLGMFLEDKHGKYFFTTCAHVIGEKEHAFSPEDNSKLGKNVFIYHSECNEHDKNDPYIDFSLVQISPERKLTCTFGLKTTGGNFINGRIFKGDLSEILNENVYKWGATAPYLRKGKCIGFEDEGSLLYLTVDTKDFAKGGDSGAIVCVGEDVETGLAAFVIVAGCTDSSEFANSSNSESSYLVYKVSDALAKVSEMKPCLIPRTIPISSPVIDSIQSTSKRKRPTDV